MDIFSNIYRGKANLRLVFWKDHSGSEDGYAKRSYRVACWGCAGVVVGDGYGLKQSLDSGDGVKQMILQPIYEVYIPHTYQKHNVPVFATGLFYLQIPLEWLLLPAM